MGKSLDLSKTLKVHGKNLLLTQVSFSGVVRTGESLASLSDQMLATFLRQKIAIQLVLPEAERRVELGTHDDSEIYDDELRDAVKQFERA